MSFNLLAATQTDEPPSVIQESNDVKGQTLPETGDTVEASAFTIDVAPDVFARRNADSDRTIIPDASPSNTASDLIAEIADRQAADADDGVEEAQSDSDAEDWDEISKGRYFGADIDKESGPLCHNCKQAGHKKKDCPHQLCRSCGALDDHDTMRCPMTQRCYNCSRLGHLASKCPEPQRQSGSYCRECGSKAHLARSCPQIWRLYLPATDFDVDGDWSVVAWCYNCAARGHYGDDCPKAHRARLLEPTAFCQANQPESRSDRRARETRERKDAERHQRLDAEERQEDWFLRQTGNAQSFRPGMNHNSFQNGNTSYGYPPPQAPASSRSSRRYDPYARPSGPVITSERFPRGMPPHNSRGKSSASQSSRPDKRQPVPAARRLATQKQNGGKSGTRGGKPYRGGGTRRR